MVEQLLSRLHGVKQTAPNKWLAKCPSHDDRSPSLAIKLADDDKILIHCFGGCSVSDVVGSIGLELSNLFPAKPGHGTPAKKPRFNASELIRLCVQESMILVIAIGDCLSGKPIGDDDKARVERAIDTISEICRETQSWG